MSALLEDIPNVVLLERSSNAEELIYAAFRQCYSKSFVAKIWLQLLRGEIPKEKQISLIENTLQSGHVTPVEHVKFTFAIDNISRALSHQLVRHRIASYSQQSQRYVDSNQFKYITPPSIQNNEQAKNKFEEVMDYLDKSYKEIQDLLINDGRNKSQANEDARYVLPNATKTSIVITMNCSSLLHFFNLRCCMRAQWEIRSMAYKMLEICKDEVPVIFKYAGEKCKSLGYCPENKNFSCGKYKTLKEILDNFNNK